jgi:aspartate racemase
VRTLGLVGGTGWPSTAEYYRALNLEVGRRTGGQEAARLVLYSLNFGDVLRLFDAEDIRGVHDLALAAGRAVVAAGAEGVVLCANTLHMFAAELERELPVPIVHIAEATAIEVHSRGFTRVGLLGTRRTMELDFYPLKLNPRGIEVLTPGEEDRAFVNRAILEELIHDRFLPETKARMLGIMGELKARGAQGIILGCTEIPLLIKQQDFSLPLLDTLALHVNAAVDFAMGEG